MNHCMFQLYLNQNRFIKMWIYVVLFFAISIEIVINVFNSEPLSMNIKAACNKLRNHCIFPVYIANPILGPDSVKVSHRLRRNINSVEYQNGISGIIFFLWTVQLKPISNLSLSKLRKDTSCVKDFNLNAYSSFQKQFSQCLTKGRT